MVKKIRNTGFIIFYVFSFAFFTQFEISRCSAVASPQSEQNEQMAQMKDVTDAIVKKAFSSLQKIENKLTELALLAKKGFFNRYINGEKLRSIITINKNLISNLLSNQIRVINLEDPIQQLESAYIITQFCNAFSLYLLKHIKTNFAQIKPFNIDKFFRKIQHNTKRLNSIDHLQPPALIQNLVEVNIKITQLDTSVKNVGLTWYNKLARKFDQSIVTPANKYHITTVAEYTGLLALFGNYALWSWGHLFRKNMPPFLKNYLNNLYYYFGGPIFYNAKTGKIDLIKSDTSDNESNDSSDSEIGGGWNSESQTDVLSGATTFAAIDYALKEIMMNTQPIGSLGAMFLFQSLKDLWTNSLKKSCSDRIHDAWNLLRGGEYLHKEPVGMIMELEPKTSFKDMVGFDEIKREFLPIIQYIDNPEQLMRMGITPEKGWLLTGPPRTGKTFSVECLCGEIKRMMEKRGKPSNLKFYSFDATIINEFGITKIMEFVKSQAPAVLFIDELDLLGLLRTGNNKVLMEFLTAMQSSMNADPSKIVIVIAATNNPQNIDKALRQNGRFGKEIRFDYPSRKYRIQYLKRELTNLALDLSKFDLEILADKTHNKTFEDLSRVIRSMTREGMRNVSLTQELLEECIDRDLHHINFGDEKDLTPEELNIIATHFAGRALLALLLKLHAQLDKVTINSFLPELKDEFVLENYMKKDPKEEQKKIEYGGYFTKQTHDTINMKNEQLVINEVMVLLAGFAAEELMLGSCGFSCHVQDHEKAYAMVEGLVFGGLKAESLPKKKTQELKNQAFNLLQKCYQDALALLQEHQETLAAIIEELTKKRTLTDKQVQAIIDSKKLHEEVV